MRKNFLLLLSVILISGFTFSYIILSKKNFFSEYLVKKDTEIYNELLNNPNDVILKYVHLPYVLEFGSKDLIKNQTNLKLKFKHFFHQIKVTPYHSQFQLCQSMETFQNQVLECTQRLFYIKQLMKKMLSFFQSKRTKNGLPNLRIIT